MNLAIVKLDPESFLERFVTVDGSSVYHYDLKSKKQSVEWRHNDSLPIVFWDVKVVILVDVLPHGHTNLAMLCYFNVKTSMHSPSSKNTSMGFNFRMMTEMNGTSDLQLKTKHFFLRVLKLYDHYSKCVNVLENYVG